MTGRRRREERERRVLALLADQGPMHGLDIRAVLGRFTYPTLARLERTGQVASWWSIGHPDGVPRRVYDLAGPAGGPAADCPTPCPDCAGWAPGRVCEVCGEAVDEADDRPFGGAA